MARRGSLVAALLLALPVAAAGAQYPPPATPVVPAGLSRQQPISVAGETISLAEIRHWARIAARGGGSRGGRPSRVDFASAAAVLIGQRAIDGEARAQGIRVSGGQVGRALSRQIAGAFSSWREFHRFLRRTGQTFADTRMLVRLDLQSSRLRKRAIGDATDPAEQQERLEAFVADFLARWRAQTLCTPRFASPSKGVPASDCANATGE